MGCLGTEPRDLPRDPLATPALAASPLVRALHRRDVRWILNGSAVLLTAGVEVVPGDLDVVPELSADNFGRLTDVLADLDAFPQPVPDWEHGLSVEEVSRWRPHPAVANLNSRFLTDYGVLDIVPDLTGSYDQLLRTARTAELDGMELLTADLAPILRRLETSSRPKDQRRWALARHLAHR